MFSSVPPETKVLITRDIRNVPSEQKADGQIGVYEGDFPVTVSMKVNGEYREYDYEQFVKWNAVQPHPIPSIEEAITSGDGAWKEKPFYMVSDYPRILLPNGSRIWGYECWWGVAEGAPSLAEAQSQTEQVIGVLRSASQTAIEEG